MYSKYVHTHNTCHSKETEQQEWRKEEQKSENIDK